MFYELDYNWRLQFALNKDINLDEQQTSKILWWKLYLLACARAKMQCIGCRNSRGIHKSLALLSFAHVYNIRVCVCSAYAYSEIKNCSETYLLLTLLPL